MTREKILISISIVFIGTWLGLVGFVTGHFITKYW